MTGDEPQVDERLLKLRNLTVRLDALGGAVLVSGGGSPYTAQNPFLIRKEEVVDLQAVVTWMGWLAGKGWKATPGDIVALAQEMTAMLDNFRS